MVERLCKEYGTALKQPEALESSNIVSVVTEKEKDPVQSLLLSMHKDPLIV